MDFFKLRKINKKCERVINKIVDSILHEKYGISPIPNLDKSVKGSMYDNYIKILEYRMSDKQILRMVNDEHLSELLFSMDVDYNRNRCDMIDFFKALFFETSEYYVNHDNAPPCNCNCVCYRKNNILFSMTRDEIKQFATIKGVKNKDKNKDRMTELVEEISKFPFVEILKTISDDSLIKIEKKLDMRPPGKSRDEIIENIIENY